MASLRDFAPRGPPLTGASRTWTPCSPNTLWMCRMRAGEVVDRSKYALPAFMPDSRPSLPSATSSTSGGAGSEVRTTSEASATLRGVSAQVAPAARCGAAASRRMSLTTSSNPPFCTFAAMLAPIVPSPMNPTFMPSSAPPPPATVSFLLVEDVPRDACRRHRGGPARIERHVGDDLADLLARHPVGQGALDMALQLIAPGHRRARGHGDEAAVAPGKAGPLPHVAVEHLLAQLDELRHHRAHFVSRRGRDRGCWRGHVILSLSGRAATRAPARPDGRLPRGFRASTRRCRGPPRPDRPRCRSRSPSPR